MKNRSRGLALLAVSLALGTPAARAQTPPPRFDLQRLTLDPAARGSLVVGDGEVAPAGDYRLALGLLAEHQPLILQPSGSYTGNGFPLQPVSGGVVADRFTAQLAFGYTVWQRLELSARLPVIGYQRAQGLAAGIAAPQTAGIVTPAFGLRYGVLAQEEGDEGFSPVSLALAGEVLTPWGATQALAGQGGTGLSGRVELGRRFGGWLVAAQGGYLYRTRAVDVSPEKPLGNEVHGGLALATTGRLRVETAARVAYDPSNGRKGVEELAGVRYAFGKLEVFALGGPGLGHLAGTPTWFAMVGLSNAGRPVTPPPAMLAQAAPPPAAAPPPPEPPPPPPPDPCAPGQQHTPAQCPLADDDGDGIPNALDRCPLVAGIPELQGCAPVDTDGDGIPDHLDRCPRVPGLARYHGCPAPRRARLQGPKIEISEAIYFTYGKAEVLERSLGLLDDVASVIEAHPEIAQVRIEGHTDSRGDPAMNRKLSLERAQQVKAYLVGKGIAADRLLARGFGPDRPVATNRTAAGRARNRRVDFFATWRAQPGS